MQWLQKQVREGMNVRTYVLVGVLVTVLLWIYSLDERTRALRARAQASVGATPAASVLAAPPARAAATTPTPLGWGEDPFQRRFRVGGEPAAAPRSQDDGPPRGAGLFLQGIMNGPRGRTALVNGEVVGEGGRVAGREVLQIGTRSVLILDRGTVVTLSLKGDG